MFSFKYQILEVLNGHAHSIRYKAQWVSHM